MARSIAGTSKALTGVLLLSLCATCEGGVGPDVPAGQEFVLLWRAPSFATSGPLAVDASSVYVIDTTRTVRALSRATGAVRWQQTLANVGRNWGVEVRDSTLVLAVERMVGLSASSGSERWRFANAEGVGTLPFTANESLVFPSSYRGVGDAVAIDLQGGTQRWRTNVLPPDSSATVADQVRVFAPFVSGSSVAASFAWWIGPQQPKGGIALLDAQTGAKRWSRMLPVLNATVSTFPSLAVVSNGTVAVTSQEGPIYVYDESTGALRWTGAKVQLVGSDTILPQNSDFRPVTIVGQSVVVGSARGYLAIHDIASGTRRSSTDTDLGAINEIHALGQSRVITTHLTGGLALIDLATGSIRWRLSPRSEAERVYAIRVAGDTVFSVSIVGGVSAFRLP